MTALAFYDHRRQHYGETLPLREGHVETEFMVGDYDEGGDGLGEMGEFAISLRRLSGTKGLSPRLAKGLSPRLEVFGDGLGAARILLALADAQGVELLGDVADRDAFSRRLLRLGLHDASDHKLCQGCGQSFVWKARTRSGDGWLCPACLVGKRSEDDDDERQDPEDPKPALRRVEQAARNLESHPAFVGDHPLVRELREALERVPR